jgi:FlaA1/EpsC-like NDP-sugar epimerase
MMNVIRHHESVPSLDEEPGGCRELWETFLQRSALSNRERVRRAHRPTLEGKRVLLTGAGGSIGSALVHSLAHMQAEELVLFDSSEGALHDVTQALLEMPEATPYTAVLGSVCDSTALAELFERHHPQIVFHAGAFKHVPLMETNPFAVIANNALGTHILVEAAAKHRCEQFILLSTDKAVDPLSLMGASKRIAELITLAPRPGIMRSKAVRLGNVLGSSGSVVPLFQRQIAQGGPVTVSHPDVRRYFMTLAEAIEALLHTLSPDCPDGLLAPDLGTPICVLDLAKYLIAQNCSEQRRTEQNCLVQTKEIPIVFTALRPGDKMQESLISTRETYADGAKDLLHRIHTPSPGADELAAALDCLREAVQHRDLNLLLEAVLRLVPEYQPSQLLREQVHSARTMVTA